MRPLDEFIAHAVALVVDGNAASRSACTRMIREAGVAEVVQAAHPKDARQLIETRRFDIVVCEAHFDRDPMSGLELMDDLRQAGLPPLSTVVVELTVTVPLEISTVPESAADRVSESILKVVPPGVTN